MIPPMTNPLEALIGRHSLRPTNPRPLRPWQRVIVVVVAGLVLWWLSAYVWFPDPPVPRYHEPLEPMKDVILEETYATLRRELSFAAAGDPRAVAAIYQGRWIDAGWRVSSTHWEENRLTQHFTYPSKRECDWMVARVTVSKLSAERSFVEAMISANRLPCGQPEGLK